MAEVCGGPAGKYAAFSDVSGGNRTCAVFPYALSAGGPVR
jgi:hypothetical protein